MRYSTTIDNARLDVDLTQAMPVLTITDITTPGKPSVTIAADGYGLIKVLRRALTDISDTLQARERTTARAVDLDLTGGK